MVTYLDRNKYNFDMLWQILSREYEHWPPDDPEDGVRVQDAIEPCSLIGHSLTLLPDGRMVVYGGWDGFSVTNSLYIYSPGSGRWSEVLSESEEEYFVGPRAIGSEWPTPAAYHSASLMLTLSNTQPDSDQVWRIVFYGGGCSSDVCGNVFQLSIEIPAKSDSRPESSSSSESAQMRYEAKTRRGKAADRVHFMKWSKISFDDEKSDFFHHPAIRPQDRMMHSATAITETRLLVLGGMGRGGRRLSDLWELNVNDWEWKEVRISGWGPASGHSAFLLTQGDLTEPST